MAKHNVGDVVAHSRFGDGQVTAVREEIRSVKPVNLVAIDGEMWSLKARIATLEAMKARGSAPEKVAVYTVEFVDGRKIDTDAAGVEKLKARVS